MLCSGRFILVESVDSRKYWKLPSFDIWVFEASFKCLINDLHFFGLIMLELNNSSVAFIEITKIPYKKSTLSKEVLIKIQIKLYHKNLPPIGQNVARSSLSQLLQGLFLHQLSTGISLVSLYRFHQSKIIKPSGKYRIFYKFSKQQSTFYKLGRLLRT